MNPTDNTNANSDHAWFTDQAAIYLAGGLDPQQKQRFQSHAAACPACAALLAALQKDDAAWRALFAADVPPPDFEDRLLQNFRRAASPWKQPLRLPRFQIHPLVRRAAFAVAATLVVGTCGYLASRTLNPSAMSARANTANRQVMALAVDIDRDYGQDFKSYSDAPRLANNLTQLGRKATVTELAGDHFIQDNSGVIRKVDAGGLLVTDADANASGASVTEYFRPIHHSEPDGRLAWGLHAKTPASGEKAEQGQDRASPQGLGVWKEQLSDVGGKTGDGTRAAPSLGYPMNVSSPNLYAGDASFATPAAVGEGKVTFSDQTDEKKTELTRLDKLTKNSTASDDYGKADKIVTMNGGSLSTLSSSGKKDEATKLGTSIISGSLSIADDSLDRSKESEVLSTITTPAAPSALPEPGAVHARQNLFDLPSDIAGKNVADGEDLIVGGNLHNTSKLGVDKLENATVADAEVARAQKLARAEFDRKLGKSLDAAEASARATPPKPDADRPNATRVSVVETTETPPAPADKMPEVGTAAQTPAPAPTAPPAPTAAEAAMQRHIIRNGSMEFEVDSFDSAALQIAKITGEEGGFIDTTNSQKLANGKVQGMVIVRVPPNHLDVLILKLRGIGDLKSQNIAAQDITKEYTDIESQLTAAKAMEARLLDLIKQGKGQIKDLLAAEKELGTWREKIDGLEGEIRYYNNLISLSTLKVSLMERDIRSAYAAMESETVSAGVETENVEQARTQAIGTIEKAKGRIIDSDLNKLDAQQFRATIVAEVPADQTGPVTDSLRQLGKVARLDVKRQQTTEGGTIPTAMAASLKIQRQQTRFEIVLYNLADIPPRQVVNLTVACPDVASAYETILNLANTEEKLTPAQAQAKTEPHKMGRVVASNLITQRAGQVSGVITLEVRSEFAAQMDNTLSTSGEVMHRTVTENPDANNVTSTKCGYSITLSSLSQVPPRQTQAISVAAVDVAGLYHSILEKLQDPQTGARVIDARLEEPDRLHGTGLLDFEVARAGAPALEAMLNKPSVSDIIERNVTRATDEQNSVDSKVRMTLRLLSAENLTPRETITAQVETSDAEQAAASLMAAAQSTGGRTIDRHITKDQGGAVQVQLIVDVPFKNSTAFLDSVRAGGTLRQLTSSKHLQADDGSLAQAEFNLTLGNANLLVAPGDSIGARFHDAIETSVKGLLLVLQCLVVGLILVLPAVLILWAAWRLLRRTKKPAAAKA